MCRVGNNGKAWSKKKWKLGTTKKKKVVRCRLGFGLWSIQDLKLAMDPNCVGDHFSITQRKEAKIAKAPSSGDTEKASTMKTSPAPLRWPAIMLIVVLSVFISPSVAIYCDEDDCYDLLGSAPLLSQLYNHFSFLFTSSWISLTRNFNVGFLRMLMLRKSRKLITNSRWNSEMPLLFIIIIFLNLLSNNMLFRFMIKFSNREFF